jgi:hypothetical protein
VARAFVIVAVRTLDEARRVAIAVAVGAIDEARWVICIGTDPTPGSGDWNRADREVRLGGTRRFLTHNDETTS